MKWLSDKEWEAVKKILEEARGACERAYFLDEEGRVEEAEEAAKKALILGEQAVESGSTASEAELAAEVCVFLGDFSRAEEYFQEAIKRVGEAICWTRDGARFPLLHIQGLEEKIKGVRKGKAPPYYRILKKENREEIGLVAFDLDGTLTQAGTHIWAVLNQKFGVEEEAARELAQRYYNREINYHTWASKAFQLIKKEGAYKRNLEEAIRQIELVPGGREAILELKRAGKKVALISGSLDIILKKLSLDNLFDKVFINKIYFDGRGEIDRFSATYHGDGKYKAKALEAMAREYGLRLKECAYVGDSLNDREVAEIAGRAIAFNSKSEEFSNLCQVMVKGDMRGILPYLGIKR